MKFIDFFAGIGGFRRGMELAGHECVGFCEFDKFATASYISMHLLTERAKNMNDQKLKPCPFCGGKAEVSVNAQTLSTKVCCKHCEVVMKRSFKGSKEIKELLINLIANEWNRRYGDETD